MFALVIKNNTKNKELRVVSKNRIVSSSDTNVRVRWGRKWYAAKLLAESDDKLWLKSLDMDADGNIIQRTLDNLIAHDGLPNNAENSQNDGVNIASTDEVVENREAAKNEEVVQNIGVTQNGDAEEIERAAENDAVAENTEAFEAGLSAEITKASENDEPAEYNDFNAASDQASRTHVVAKTGRTSKNERTPANDRGNDASSTDGEVADNSIANNIFSDIESSKDNEVNGTADDDVTENNAKNAVSAGESSENDVDNYDDNEVTETNAKEASSDEDIAETDADSDVDNDVTNDDVTDNSGNNDSFREEPIKNDENNASSSTRTSTISRSAISDDAVTDNDSFTSDDGVTDNGVNRKVELTPGSGVLISERELFDIKSRWTHDANEMVRRIMRSVVGVERLVTMTPAGRGRFRPIPIAIREATEQFVFDNVVDERRLNHAQYMRVLTNMCNNARSSK